MDEQGAGRDEQQAAKRIDHPQAEEVDRARFEHLSRKRETDGLNDDEANELGRMIAAKEGQPYRKAAAREHPDAIPMPESMPTEEGPAVSPRRIPSDPKAEEPPDDAARELAG